MRWRSADEPDATRGPDEKAEGVEVSFEKEMPGVRRTRPRAKGKGKGNGGKGEHGSKGGTGSKGTHQVSNMIEEDHGEDGGKLVKMVQEEDSQEGQEGQQEKSGGRCDVRKERVSGRVEMWSETSEEQGDQQPQRFRDCFTVELV